MAQKIFKTLTLVFIMGGGTSCYTPKVSSIKILKNSKVGWTSKDSCRFIYYDGNKEIHVTGGIKCRGGVSSKYYKNSYTIELDNNLILGGLDKDDDWILNANYIDKTFMRHKISYDLYSACTKLSNFTKGFILDEIFTFWIGGDALVSANREKGKYRQKKHF